MISYVLFQVQTDSAIHCATCYRHSYPRDKQESEGEGEEEGQSEEAREGEKEKEEKGRKEEKDIEPNGSDEMVDLL